VISHPVTVIDKVIIKLLHDDIKERILLKEIGSNIYKKNKKKNSQYSNIESIYFSII